MREAVEMAISKFISRDLPRDAAYFQEKKKEVIHLVKRLKLLVIRLPGNHR